MRTISRWPCAIRGPDLAEDAAARRLRVAPRTSGMTQKWHEKEQPSWIFTNARTRSSRASRPGRSRSRRRRRRSARPPPRSGRGRPSRSRGSPANADSESRAPQPVTKTRSCVRAARAAAWRDFASASFVTQHVFTTAISPAGLGVAVARAAARARPARRCGRPCSRGRRPRTAPFANLRESGCGRADRPPSRRRDSRSSRR